MKLFHTAKWNARDERKALAKVWSTGRSSRILKWNEFCSVLPRLSAYPLLNLVDWVLVSFILLHNHPKLGRVGLQKLWVCN